MICNVHCLNCVSTEYSLFLLSLVTWLFTCGAKLVHYIRKTPQTAAASIPSDPLDDMYRTTTVSTIQSHSLCVCVCMNVCVCK